jgi:hypothetical protein
MNDSDDGISDHALVRTEVYTGLDSDTATMSSQGWSYLRGRSRSRCVHTSLPTRGHGHQKEGEQKSAGSHRNSRETGHCE